MTAPVDLAALRARCTRQRRELRRLNAAIRASNAREREATDDCARLAAERDAAMALVAELEAARERIRVLEERACRWHGPDRGETTGCCMHRGKP